MTTTPLKQALRHNAYILVLNQEPLSSIVIGLILHLYGYGVRRAANPAKARGYVEQKTPDLILTDALALQSDWKAMIREFREKPDLQDVPWILIYRKEQTTFAELEDLDLDASMPVPFSPEEFQCVLQPFLAEVRHQPTVSRVSG